MTADDSKYRACGYLERTIQVLRADVQGKLREVRFTLDQHTTGEIGLSPEHLAASNAEAMAYASVLDLIDSTMRDNGIPQAHSKLPEKEGD